MLHPEQFYIAEASSIATPFLNRLSTTECWSSYIKANFMASPCTMRKANPVPNVP